jgi:hypothetical protein
MKFVSGFLILASLMIACRAVSKEDVEKHDKIMREMLMECKNIENGSDDDVESLMKASSLPETHSGKCMMTCIVEKMGYVRYKTSF